VSKRQRRRQEKRRRHSLQPTRRHLAAGAGLTIGATLGAAGTAHATDYIVDDLGNSGPGTLRQAVLDANANPGPDRILFESGLSGTIHLLTPDLDIADPVEILGPGPGTLAVTQDSSDRIAHVHPGNGESVTISGLTLHDANDDPTGFAFGGVIFSGSYNSESNLTISNSVLTGSEAQVLGGAIYVDNGTLQVDSSTISGNRAGVYGGGIYFTNTTDAAQSTISNSTIAGNTATAGDGGGVYVGNGYTQGPIVIQNSTITGNSAGNDEDDNGGGVYDFNDPPVVTIESSTIVGNSAANAGGGLFFQYGDTVLNSIIAGNSAGSFGPDLAGDNPINTAFDLIGNPSGATINELVPGSNVLGVDPQLGALASNGGPTQTMALPPTSPAVDKGSSSLGTDQRGSPRPVDGATIPNSAAAGGNGADIGAFELQDLPAAAAPKCAGKTATVFRDGLSRSFTGTNRRDVIVGTSARDTINARGGNDLVCAKGGKDSVKGRGGKDKLFGQRGKDTLRGGAKRDVLKGGAGKDKLFGQGGRDKLVGGAKNDTCVGGPGKDTTKGC
jgi:Ca2+-binding RTX toxin-like protein